MTSDGEEGISRAKTIEWVFHVALLSSTRYREILQDEEVLKCVYPETFFTSDNPKITHTIEGSDYIFTTTKNEIVREHNFNLLKAHLIALSIVGLTTVLEHYLKEILKNHFGKEVRFDVFNKFKEAFKEKKEKDIEGFDKYDELLTYYNLRHIIVHNLSRIDEKFKNNTETDQEEGEPYVYYPKQVSEYKELIEDFVDFVDSYLD